MHATCVLPSVAPLTGRAVYIRVVSSYRLFSAFLNWFKVVRGLFALFTQFLSRPVRKESNAPMLKTRIKKSMY